MTIGKMDQVANVYTESYIDDGVGGRETVLTDIGQFWCEVIHLTGDEREHAMRDADKVAVAFRMHNFEGFPASTTSIIEWSGTRYDITDREFEGTQQLYVTFKAVAGEYLG